jgi:hypothetical protein
MAISAVLVAVATITAVLIASGRPAKGAVTGISSIPGMSEVGSNAPALCSGTTGTALPDYCSWVGATQVYFQGWVLNVAISAYGPVNHGLVLPVPLGFADQHPGPAEVFVSVVNFSNQEDANRLLNDPEYTRSWDPAYTALPADAINGGVAFRIDSLSNDGLTEYRFAWVGGTSVVEVNVLGANMSVGAAQDVAKLATPA